MLAVAWWGVWLAWRGRLETSRGFLGVAQWMLPSGFIAVLAGWTVTEVGRQPWAVYGLLRTADSVIASLTGTDVALYQIPRDKSPLAGDNSLNHQQAGTYKKLISIGKWYYPSRSTS
jgi:hypothetical protein